MGYHGGRLTPWFSSRHNDGLCRSVVGAVSDRMTEVTKMNTPIVTGKLRESWYRKPIKVTIRGDHKAYESGVASDVEYAPYVEHGTGLWGPKHAKYVILPKKPGGMLRWFDHETGQWVFARKVMHPGSQGQHMVAIGVAIAEHELQALAEPHLRSWAGKVERQNKTSL